VYHIERLEGAYQDVVIEKQDIEEKLQKSQQQVTSVHSLSQQLLKTAKYWQQRAEKSEQDLQLRQQEANTVKSTVVNNTTSNTTRVNNTTTPNTTAARSYLPPPTRQNMSAYAKSGDMKNFF